MARKILDGNVIDADDPLDVVDAGAAPPATPTLYNPTLTNADQEYLQALPVGVKRFGFQCRIVCDIRYAFESGFVAGPTDPYTTLKAGGYANSGEIHQPDAPSTLYLASSVAGVVVELSVWR